MVDKHPLLSEWEKNPTLIKSLLKDDQLKTIVHLLREAHNRNNPSEIGVLIEILEFIVNTVYSQEE